MCSFAPQLRFTLCKRPPASEGLRAQTLIMALPLVVTGELPQTLCESKNSLNLTVLQGHELT